MVLRARGAARLPADALPHVLALRRHKIRRPGRAAGIQLLELVRDDALRRNSDRRSLLGRGGARHAVHEPAEVPRHRAVFRRSRPFLARADFPRMDADALRYVHGLRHLLRLRLLQHESPAHDKLRLHPDFRRAHERLLGTDPRRLHHLLARGRHRHLARRRRAPGRERPRLAVRRALDARLVGNHIAAHDSDIHGVELRRHQARHEVHQRHQRQALLRIPRLRLHSRADDIQHQPRP